MTTLPAETAAYALPTHSMRMVSKFGLSAAVARQGMRLDPNEELRTNGSEALRARFDSADTFTPPPKQERSRPEKPNFGRVRILQLCQIRLSRAPRYLIKGLIPKEGIVVVWGAPKCGKTFVVMDASLRIALGLDFRGKRVKQGAIVYCAFEGQAGVQTRIEGWCRSFLPEDRDRSTVPFFIQTLRLALVDDHPELIEAVVRCLGGISPAAIILDTLNKSITGSESSDVDMGNYISAAETIREAFKCAVIIVHHCGWDASRLRGHSSLRGALDAEIVVSKRGDIVTTEVIELKDGEAGFSFASQLKIVDLGFDDDGDPITTCIMEPYEGVPSPKTTRTPTVADITFDDAFNEISCKNKISHAVNQDGPKVAAVLVHEVEAEFKRRHITDSGDARRGTEAKKKAWQRALEQALKKRNYAGENRPDGAALLWRM
jgi:hypothetical protein